MQIHKHNFSGKLLFCFVCISLNLLAQVRYVNDSSFINILPNSAKNNLHHFSYSKMDSSINNFHNYALRNTNGNIGLPSAPLYIRYMVKPLGFNLYHAPYDNDVIREEDVNYFQTKGPYASLTGIAGSKQEQMFKLLFSNTFKNKLNITLAFNRYGSLGFYKRQQTFTNNFYLSSNYINQNGRAGYYTFLLFNRFRHLENGGISKDSLFLKDVSINKQLLPVRLSNAKRDYRTTSVDINTWFRLNKTEDSSTVLSHFIDYQLHYSGNYTKYTDAGIGVDHYYNLFLDTVTTKDSTHWRTVSNALNYTLKFNPLHAKLQLGVKNEYNQVHQYIDSTFINNSVHAGLFVTKSNYVGFLKADYIFEGVNSNDYSIEFSNKYKHTILKVPFVFSMKAQFEKRHPDFIYNTWYSNHFIWNNQFSPTDKQQLLLSISTADNRFDIGTVYQNVKNQLYVNESALPQQTNIPIQNVSFFIHKDLLVLKHLGLNTQYTYQMSSYQSIIPVPNHVINGALYYQGSLFKNNLQLQIGFDANYFSEFYGYAYMPATNLYYVHTSKTVGNYPYIDFFLNARIKPVRFFIKIDHINQGLMGHRYSLAPGYLQNDRAFKFGINWLFFD